MKTQIVYTITSDNNDVYLEQVLVSLYSLRLYNPDATVILIVDDITNKTLYGQRAHLLKFITKKIVITVPSEYNKVQRSRFLKTSIRENIKGDYLFIDSDTIITASLKDIDNFPNEIGAVKDYHLYFKDIPAIKSILQKAKKIQWNVSNDDLIYFNSGVIFAKDTPKVHILYKKWQEIWKESVKKNMYYDQPALGKANAECGYIIKELDGTWNCQLLTKGLKYLYQSRIIHYFSSTQVSYSKIDDSVYYFLNKKIYEEIKMLGYIPEHTIEAIKHAQSAFSTNYELYYGTKYDFINSKTCKALKRIYFKHPILFKIIERILKCCFSA